MNTVKIMSNAKIQPAAYTDGKLTQPAVIVEGENNKTAILGSGLNNSFMTASENGGLHTTATVKAVSDILPAIAAKIAAKPEARNWVVIFSDSDGPEMGSTYGELADYYTYANFVQKAEKLTVTTKELEAAKAAGVKVNPWQPLRLPVTKTVGTKREAGNGLDSIDF